MAHVLRLFSALKLVTFRSLKKNKDPEGMIHLNIHLRVCTANKRIDGDIIWMWVFLIQWDKKKRMEGFSIMIYSAILTDMKPEV